MLRDSQGCSESCLCTRPERLREPLNPRLHVNLFPPLLCRNVTAAASLCPTDAPALRTVVNAPTPWPWAEAATGTPRKPLPWPRLGVPSWLTRLVGEGRARVQKCQGRLGGWRATRARAALSGPLFEGPGTAWVRGRLMSWGRVGDPDCGSRAVTPLSQRQDPRPLAAWGTPPIAPGLSRPCAHTSSSLLLGTDDCWLQVTEVKGCS